MATTDSEKAHTNGSSIGISSPASEATANRDEKTALGDSPSLESRQDVDIEGQAGIGMSTPHEWLFICVLCMAQLTTQIGLTQTLSILHPIAGSFGVTDAGQQSWAIAGYSLTTGTFILFAGRLGDIFGHKLMLLIGYAWFSVWTMLSGVAVYANYDMFVVARVLQGIGPALCLPNALAILGRTYPPGHRKAMIFAIFGAAAPLGAIFGAAISSVFELAWWPWAFWWLSIALAMLGVLGYYTVPSPSRDEAVAVTRENMVQELDLLGAGLGITALVCFNFAWNQAPVTGWDSPEVIVTLILGVGLFAAFMVQELRYARYPLIPLSIMTSENMLILAALGCGWADFGIWLFYLWQILQQIRGLSPLLTVAWLSPLAPMGVVAAVLTGIIMGPMHVRPAFVMTIALTAFLVGTILVATVPVDQIYWAQTFVCVLIMPFGMDMTFPAATLMLSNAVEAKHQGVAASLANTIVNYSISIGLGIAGTVEVHVGMQDGHHDLLKGFRGALYMAIGLAGLGLALCVPLIKKAYTNRL